MKVFYLKRKQYKKARFKKQFSRYFKDMRRVVEKIKSEQPVIDINSIDSDE